MNKTLTSLNSVAANGLRYPLVGGTRQRHFAGTNFKPRKLVENAQTPTRRVHAVSGCLYERHVHCYKQMIKPKDEMLF